MWMREALGCCIQAHTWAAHRTPSRVLASTSDSVKPREPVLNPAREKAHQGEASFHSCTVFFFVLQHSFPGAASRARHGQEANAHLMQEDLEQS